MLHGTRLYYFRAWEDYGCGGLGAAVNIREPIEMAVYEPMVVGSEEGPNRFDLVHTGDPLARKWDLQAGLLYSLRIV